MFSGDQHHSFVELADSNDEPLLSAYICQLGMSLIMMMVNIMMTIMIILMMI